jgi:CDP-diglyceride synthetase
VLRLIFAFVDIMLHRRGPADLPSSQFLLWVLLAISVAVELGLLAANGGGGRAAVVGLLVAFLDLWFVWALLRAFGRERRFKQTMTALLGTETILSLVGAPLVPLVVAAASPEPQVTLPVILTALLGVWSIDIGAYVFSRALDRPYALCVAIMIAYVLMILTLRTTLLQPTAAA